MNKWLVYILECFDDTLYVGITNNLEKRIKDHNSDNSRTKYTRSRRPIKLLKSFECENKSEALKLEYKIKKMSRQEKLKL